MTAQHLLSGGDNVRGAPDLVVEILSPATADRDLGYKRALYARARGEGVLAGRPGSRDRLDSDRLRDGELAAAHTFGRNETLRSPLLAGFDLALNEVFSS